MTRFLSTLALLFALCAPAPAAKPAAPPLPLEQFLHGPGMDGGIAGVEVCDARTGKVLFAHNAATRLLPASNAKLFTAAAALELLGEPFTWTTKVVSAQKPDAAGVVNGDVYLVGAGDASLVTADLNDLAAQMQKAGIKRVTGALYGDGSLFTDGPYGFGWEWDDLNDEEFPQISALTMNEGLQPVQATAGKKAGDWVRISLFPQFGGGMGSDVVTEASGQVSDLHITRPYGEHDLNFSGALPIGAVVTQNFPIDDPPWYVKSMLEFALLPVNIHISSAAQQDRMVPIPGFTSVLPTPPDATNVLASHTSAPLSQYVTHMLKESDNLYAECLVRTVGVEAGKKGPPGPPILGGETSKAQSTTSSPSLVGREAQTASQNILPPNLGGRGGLPPSGTFAAGYAAELPALQKLGVDMSNVTLVDGCGVGRRNYVTARAVCQLLLGMKKSVHYATFYNALPVAGVDGTLKSRMKGTPAAVSCHAKTGTLGAVRALSGYVTGKSGTPYVFSILLNNFPGTAHQAGAVQDNIVEWLAVH